jgi:hypothetical protein
LVCIDLLVVTAEDGLIIVGDQFINPGRMLTRSKQ